MFRFSLLLGEDRGQSLKPFKEKEILFKMIQKARSVVLGRVEEVGFIPYRELLGLFDVFSQKVLLLT